MDQLNEISNRLIKNVNRRFTRRLYQTINWDDRLIEIQGSRGVGKTTLMLQKAGEYVERGLSALYVSADSPYFYKNMLYETAEEFYKFGGKYLFIDEVHKYPKKHPNMDWASEIKSIYDSIPDLYVCYSGSSILQLYTGAGDLSRRKSGYFLNGLSFGEYLVFFHDLKVDPLTLPEMLKNHQGIASDLSTRIKVLPLFDEYLIHGYYPFYKENPQLYFNKLNEIIQVILEIDIPHATEIAYLTIFKIKKFLAAIASSVPYTPNLHKIRTDLDITDHRTLLKYLDLLEKAELIKTLGANATGDKIMNKPRKVYLNNTNLLYAIEPEHANQGTMRETFFINQLSYQYKVSYPESGDFLVNSQYLFETGGRNKDFKQIAGKDQSYLAVDGIETGFGNRVPLWMFGLLY